MAGYGAVVSLQQTIEHILQSSRISLDPSSAEILQIICRELESLGEILESLDDISPSKSRKKVNALDGQIKEAVWRFEDLIESHLSDQILSRSFESDSDRELLFPIDLLQKDVGSLIETVKDMKMAYIHELDNMPPVEEDELSAVVSSSRSSFGGLKAKMVGFSGALEHVKKILMDDKSRNVLYTLLGMPGIGKTTFAQKLFEDPEVQSWFDHRVWITVGRKYELNEIARRFLVQVDPPNDEIVPQAEDDKKHKHLNRVLRWFDRGRVRDDRKKIRKYLREGKRCLIVLDNVWDSEVIDYFDTLMAARKNEKTRILVTSNLDKVRRPYNERRSALSRHSGTMQPLNEEESEELLRIKVFGEEVEDFPPHLEKAAKKIAKNCKGLPLMIVLVANLLLKANKNHDPEFWNEVAENRNSDVMMAARNQLSKVLFPVYDCFPQSSKMFYLYMGAFPQDSEIRASKLINMLTAEGFFELQKLHKIFDNYMEFFDMVSNTVVISQRKRLKLVSLILPGVTCSTKNRVRTSFFS